MWAPIYPPYFFDPAAEDQPEPTTKPVRPEKPKAKPSPLLLALMRKAQNVEQK